MQNIKLLAKDVLSRGWRGVFVVVLTVIAALVVTNIGIPSWLYPFGVLIFLLSFVGILYLIIRDSSRTLHFSKEACYSVIIIGTLWVMALINALINPQNQIFNFVVDFGSETGVTGVYLLISPLLLVSIIAVLVAATGSVAYRVGTRRKDIKGIKKEKLFK